MKKLSFLISLMVLLLITPPAADQNGPFVANAANNLQGEPNDVHLENYGVRHILENGRRHSVGLYKIIIGDPLDLELALSLNKSSGFDGLVFTPHHDNKDDWHKIRVHRPVKQRRGWKKRDVVKKDRLPYPFNTMDQDLLDKILFINVYPDNNGVTVVYIIEGTEFADCEKLFNYISEKRRHRKKPLPGQHSSG